MRSIIAKVITFFGLIAVLSVELTASAEAQETRISAPAPEVPPLGRWSLGAGVGFSGTGDVGLTNAYRGVLAGSSVSPANSQTPYGTALAEIALSPVFRLVLGMQGGYSRQLSRERDPKPESIVGRGPEGDSYWTLGGAIGARAVLNPGGIVEISPILMFGGYRSASETTYMSGKVPEFDALLYATRKSSTVGWDARLGLVLEYSLLPNLFLRFETYFVRLGYGKASTEDTIPEPPTDLDSKLLFSMTHEGRSDLALNYGVSPSLQLRMSF